MRTRIWNELNSLKHNIEYLRVYSIFQAKLSRWINISILMFSSSGVLGWSIFEKPALAGIACGLTGGVTLLKMISPFFILSDKETKILDKYYVSLISQYDSLEQFWYQSENENKEQSEVTSEFYRITSNGNKIHDRYSYLNIIHLQKLIKKADINTNDYFKHNFNI